MPVMNGLELYLALKKIKPNIKVVMMTAYRQEVKELVDEAIRNDAYACIYKPFEPDRVLSLVEEILARKDKSEIQKMEASKLV